MDQHKALTTPTLLCLWRDYLGLELCEHDGFLYIFERNFNYIAYPPYGEGDLVQALKNIKEYQKSKFGKNLIICINENQKNQFEKLGFTVNEDENRHEYVYLSENLAYLEGKKYHKKRNHISNFKKNYDYEYQKIDSSNFSEVTGFLEKWYAERMDSMTAELKHEKQALLNFIEFIDKINYKAAIIKVNNEVAAFTAGEIIADDMAVIYFEKATEQYKSVYPVINNEFILNEFIGIKYINRQEDLGIEGLRRAKKSYYPEFLVKNYTMESY
ncbi:MAG: DUF2156 domain-containing protein [Clostridia bacterium]|nr:DUF2156 domain-containing protein [Clostridia bacterium]